MRRIVALAALVSMTIVGACGSDGDRLTAEEFIAQGNAICVAASAEVETVGDELFAEGVDPSDEAIGAFVDETLVPAVEGMIDDFKELNPPEELEEPVNQMVADLQAAHDDIVEATADDPGALFAAGDPFADTYAQAAEIGLTECAGDAQG